MKIQNHYHFAAGILFLIIAAIGLANNEPGIYITFFIMGLVFVAQGVAKRNS